MAQNTIEMNKTSNYYLQEMIGGIWYESEIYETEDEAKSAAKRLRKLSNIRVVKRSAIETRTLSGTKSTTLSEEVL